MGTYANLVINKRDNTTVTYNCKGAHPECLGLALATAPFWKREGNKIVATSDEEAIKYIEEELFSWKSGFSKCSDYNYILDFGNYFNCKVQLGFEEQVEWMPLYLVNMLNEDFDDVSDVGGFFKDAIDNFISADKSEGTSESISSSVQIKDCQDKQVESKTNLMSNISIPNCPVSIKWAARYFEIAELVSSWSKDPSTKVGAIIVGDKGQIISQGYNGFPRGVDDDENRYNHRETKYKFVVHAEMNAILNALYNGSSVVGASIYIHNLPVCQECAKAIVQSGISHVFIDREIDSKWQEAWQFSKIMFKEAGVKVFKFNKDSQELIFIDG